jgi:uncharacterized protein (DUF983 family)
LIVQTLTAILQAWLALKIFGIKFELNYCLKILFYILVVGILSYAVFAFVNMDWIFKIIITLLLFVLAAFGLKIFSLKEIKSLLG